MSYNFAHEAIGIDKYNVPLVAGVKVIIRKTLEKLAPDHVQFAGKVAEVVDEIHKVLVRLEDGSEVWMERDEMRYSISNNLTEKSKAESIKKAYGLKTGAQIAQDADAVTKKMIESISKTFGVDPENIMFVDPEEVG